MIPDTSFLYDPIGIIIFLVSLSLAPFVALMVTSFVKLVIVINLIRQAMGLQQIPPNMVVNGLAIILTLYIMAPTLQESIHRAFETNDILKMRKQLKEAFVLPDKFKPYMASQDNSGLSLTSFASEYASNERTEQMLSEIKALLNYTKQPITQFLTQHTPQRQSIFFMRMAKRLWPDPYTRDLKEDDLLICIPAFMLSELSAAFEIGFLIYLPFIAIDLVVSNILLAMGMMMVSPMTISLPFKLMLFVLVNGWAKLVEALLLTYV
ncbi:MAG: EscR/YscR/HrcR family type III secretion system export apparatus protein [Puniceicoccales bacterium]|jgi:type III secretion protein R|nr:EscR/YscR/HrcR family type III secretion system export apparatus protein [Puniceicoccales bacterium]